MRATNGAATRKRPTPWPNPAKGSDMEQGTYRSGRRLPADIGERRLHSSGYLRVKL
jgi:hypothetical protein